MFSTGPAVPRHLRNLRRAYDEEGREITPATIAEDKTMRLKALRLAKEKADSER